MFGNKKQIEKLEADVKALKEDVKYLNDMVNQILKAQGVMLKTDVKRDEFLASISKNQTGLVSLVELISDKVLMLEKLIGSKMPQPPETDKKKMN